MDMGVLGGAIAAVGSVAAGIWAWWLRNKKAVAETRAEVAESDASKAVADAQQTVYKLLNERLTTLESEVRGLRQELVVERAHSRKLELQIVRLDRWIRSKGLEPPTFAEDLVG